MVDHLEYSDGQLLASVGHAYRAVAEACMHTMGLRRAQVLLLTQIYKQEGITQIELAERLSMNGGTVSEMLQRMEDTQLIVRQRDAEDRRLVRVYLTEAGREKEIDIHRQFQNLEKAIFDGVHPEQRVALRRLLHQLLHNMNQVSHDAEGFCCK
jgi:MarR family transcriptional regulator, organic hydroperoxide resistance regulator